MNTAPTSGIVALALFYLAAACGDDAMNSGPSGGQGGAAGVLAGQGGAGSGGSGGALGGTGGSAGASGAAGSGGTQAGGGGATGGAGAGGSAGAAGMPATTCDPADFPRRDCAYCDPEDTMRCEVCGADDGCDSSTYTDNGDGTVTSSCCGLVWQQAVEGVSSTPFDYCNDAMPTQGCFTWTEARAYCDGLQLAGGGWRLPYVRELLSLLRAYKSSDWNESAFPNAPDDWFWSATEGWMVTFDVGDSSLVGDKHLRVRCVR